MALMDGPGYAGADGKTEFAYAHPLFWAPVHHHRRRRHEMMLKGGGKTIVRIRLGLLLGIAGFSPPDRCRRKRRRF